MEFWFNDVVVLKLDKVKLVRHHEPILHLGADLFCGGWRDINFKWIGVGRKGQGLIAFHKGSQTIVLPLLNAPTLQGVGTKPDPPLSAPPAPISTGKSTAQEVSTTEVDRRIKELQAQVKELGRCV